jgi:hypothetical protein
MHGSEKWSEPQVWGRWRGTTLIATGWKPFPLKGYKSREVAPSLDAGTPVQNVRLITIVLSKMLKLF